MAEVEKSAEEDEQRAEAGEREGNESEILHALLGVAAGDDDAFVGVRRIDPNGDFRADGVRGLACECLVLGDDARGLRERPAVARVFGAAIAVGILDAVSVDKSVAGNVLRLADVPIRPAYEDGRLNFVPREGFFRELGLVLHEEMHGEAEEEEQRAHGR